MVHAINTLRLCERLNMSPAELAEVDAQQEADWLTVIRTEGFLARSRASLPPTPGG